MHFVSTLFMPVSATSRKPLGVRVTPEEYEILRSAAVREDRSVSNFVLRAALAAAQTDEKPLRTREQTLSLMESIRAEFKARNAGRHDPVAELLAERRKEVARSKR